MSPVQGDRLEQKKNRQWPPINYKTDQGHLVRNYVKHFSALLLRVKQERQDWMYKRRRQTDEVRYEELDSPSLLWRHLKKRNLKRLCKRPLNTISTITTYVVSGARRQNKGQKKRRRKAYPSSSVKKKILIQTLQETPG
jgi:hypothetical protein